VTRAAGRGRGVDARHRRIPERRRAGIAKIAAVTAGRMHASVRNPSCRIHGGAIVAGVAAVVSGQKTGPGGIPKIIVADGPVVTKENAPGLAWMEQQFLI